MTYRMERICEQLGEAVTTPEDVVEQFGGKSIHEIIDILDETYPTDNNRGLSIMIWTEIK